MLVGVGPSCTVCRGQTIVGVAVGVFVRVSVGVGVTVGVDVGPVGVGVPGRLVDDGVSVPDAECVGVTAVHGFPIAAATAMRSAAVTAPSLLTSALP